ncbi:hypothetical protein diail_12042 [Diaporthe ilicicola]|nr:hypothetical protein diail_12042 [Diaporthe ilicicola]
MARKKGTGKAAASTPLESTCKSTLSTTTMTSGFAMKAYKNGILDRVSSKPPTNIEDIRARYAESRGTASPTGSIFEDYVDTVATAPNEASMVFEVGGQLLKRYPRERYSRAFNQAFTSFPEDTGFNNGLSAPQPDFAEGLEIPEYCPFPIDEHIEGAVIYKENPRSLVLPHIAGEWKGPGKNMEAARLQSAYDGAALVYARAQALSYMGESDPPGHSEVTTFTTDGTNLNFYAHHATPSAAGDGKLQYHQYLVKSDNLVASHQGLKDGRRGLRNGQDHAKKQSYALRDRLVENWRKHRDTLRPLAEGAPVPVADGTVGETSTDEAAYVVVEQPCQPAPGASRSASSTSLWPEGE